jgi:hypothetical protein
MSHGFPIYASPEEFEGIATILRNNFANNDAKAAGLIHLLIQTTDACVRIPVDDFYGFNIVGLSGPSEIVLFCKATTLIVRRNPSWKQQ